MDIHATYEPSVNELASASSLFIEKKPFLRFSVIVLNMLAALLIIMLVTKFFVAGITPQEWSALFVGLIWIFGRRPFNEWLLTKKMKNANIAGKAITIDFSRNGITWAGEALKNGSIAWAHVHYVMIAKNGFLFPQSATKFLWVPFRAFRDQHSIEELTAFVKEQHIKIRWFKWHVSL